MAVGGVLLFAAAIRLVNWGSNAISQHLEDLSDARILGHVLSPSPVRTPVGVVRVQINALRNNDDPLPNTGLATFYNFMEPGIRARLGSFSEYVEHMTGSAYADLFTKAELRVSPMRTQGDLAQQFVYVTTSPEERSVYIVTLKRQESGPYAGCWMNQNVVRYTQEHPRPASE